MNLKLHYKIGDQKEEQALFKETTTLGRGVDNNIVLTDFSISRSHCAISQKNEQYYVQDTGSRNGTFVNGKKITEATPIKAGDRLTLGVFPLEMREQDFASESSQEVVLEDRPFYQRPGTVIKSVGSMLASETGHGQKTAVHKAVKAKTAEQDLTGLFSVLSQVAKTLISADSLQDILDKVLQLTFDHLKVERGVLMLYSETENKLKPTVVKQKDDSGDQLVVSKTITEKVFKEHVSILTSDASLDPRFSSSESIIFHGIRSAMCVPLWNDGEVVGIIYADSQMTNNMFSTPDLDFLTALANYAAVAIQRARLHQRVQLEMAARTKLSRYHSPNVVTKILASKGEEDELNIEAQELDVTVLFSDIVGFTTISEQLTPKEVSSFLNLYFHEMTDIIFRHDGTLDKFIGDAVMAVFGAPLPDKNHALQAVRSAIEMRDALARIDMRKELGLDVDINVRFGINSGMVVAGDIGSPQRMDYTVIGDTVNAASRIEEDIAATNEVVVSESTWEAVKDHFEFVELGTINLRGRLGSTRCFRVIREI
jgi:adenylate cyclase